MSSVSLGMMNYPHIGVVRVTWPILNFWYPIIYIFGMGQARVFRFYIGRPRAGSVWIFQFWFD